MGRDTLRAERQALGFQGADTLESAAGTRGGRAGTGSQGSRWGHRAQPPGPRGAPCYGWAPQRQPRLGGGQPDMPPPGPWAHAGQAGGRQDVPCAPPPRPVLGGSALSHSFERSSARGKKATPESHHPALAGWGGRSLRTRGAPQSPPTRGQAPGHGPPWESKWARPVAWGQHRGRAPGACVKAAPGGGVASRPGTLLCPGRV